MMDDPRLKAALTVHQAGNLAEAARLYDEILRIEPKNFHAIYFLGYLHIQQRDFLQAEHLLAAALAIDPLALDALYNRGRVLVELKRYVDALSCFDAMLTINPNIHEALFQRGTVLCECHRFEDAVADFNRVVALAPDFVEAWNNRGNALSGMGRLDEALVNYERALSLRTNDHRTLNHRAVTLFELKRYAEAARDFASVLKAEPEFPYARGNLLFSKLHGCDWQDLERESERAIGDMRSGMRVLMPIHATALVSLPEDQLKCSEIFSADQYSPAPEPLWRGQRYRHERIKVAYLSAHLHAHAVAFLSAGLFEAHDRSRFETIAVSFGPDEPSHMRQRLKGAFEHFIDVRGKDDFAVATMLKEMEVDIAVDLCGHTQGARTGILAHRPAPVQVNYLGFPGTLGASCFDYVIADRIVTPDEHASRYSEKIVTLPDTYQCNDRTRPIAPLIPARAECGLPHTGFVFCSFNNSFKIRADMFDVWMRVLRQVEGSVLWLLEDNALAVRNLRREAERRLVAPERLVFAPRVTPQLHLARHALADLFLDTLPYGAHTTASDALWAGVPVLTCMGGTFAGRVAASLLHAVGLPEMITHTLDDYQALAVKLATDRTALAPIARRLRDNRDSHPLFDTVRFTRHLEAAYTRMWNRAQRGEAPDHFAVPAKS